MPEVLLCKAATVVSMDHARSELRDADILIRDGRLSRCAKGLRGPAQSLTVPVAS